MGAWGTGPFENDDASDWVYELEGAEGVEVLEDAFAVAVDADEDDLDRPDGCNAIAAAEVVAALKGNPREGGLPEQVGTWVTAHAKTKVPAKLNALAVKAVKRVLADSEVADLWNESGDAEWRQTVNDLLERLNATK